MEIYKVHIILYFHRLVIYNVFVIQNVCEFMKVTSYFQAITIDEYIMKYVTFL